MKTETFPRFEMRPLSEEEGGGYLVEFPDYPGCVADGETPEQAIAEARDALKSYMATDVEQGEPVASPNEKKGSVTDRVSYRLNNPTPEDEARFQEYIKNN